MIQVKKVTVKVYSENITNFIPLWLKDIQGETTL